MSPSLDLGKQLLTLAQEAAILQSQIAHRTSELQAVQKKLSNLQSKFDSETTRLVAEQETELKEAIAPFQAELQRLKEDIDKQQHLIAANIPKIQAQKDEMRTLAESISVRRNDLAAANSQLRGLMERSDQASGEVKAAGVQLQSIRQDTAAATEEKQGLEIDIDAFCATKDALSSQIATLYADYKQQVASKGKTVAILEAKILDLSQKAEAFGSQEETTRQNLADWQRILEERDRNLRVREMKVEEGEGKLIANANLMNL